MITSAGTSAEKASTYGKKPGDSDELDDLGVASSRLRVSVPYASELTGLPPYVNTSNCRVIWQFHQANFGRLGATRQITLLLHVK